MQGPVNVNNPATAIRRLKKQFIRLKDQGQRSFSAQPIDMDNLYQWKAIIQGPVNSPYKHGTFILLVTFSQDYPFRPMKIRFQTPIFHPNINSHGSIQNEYLHVNWSPAWWLGKILSSIIQMLSEPNFDCPICIQASQLYKKSVSQFQKKAKQYTIQYAIGNSL